MRSLALLALASAATASALEKRQTPTGDCASLHVIAIGGSNSPDQYSLGLLSTLTDSIVAAVPGADSSSLPYNKVQPSPGVLAPGAIPAAITLLGQYVADYNAACPNSKMAIIGYSSGAVIASVASCTSFTVPQSLAGNTIVAQIWYGAETYNLGQSYDAGTCTSGEGKQPLANPAGCGAFIPITKSYCDENDPQCCGGPPEDYQVHFNYPPEYDGQATDFVVQQYHAAGGAMVSHHSKSHSASSTSTPTSTKTKTHTPQSHTSVVSKTPKPTHESHSMTTATKTTPTTHKSSTSEKPSTSASSSPATAAGAPSSTPSADTSGNAATSLSNGSVLFNAAFIGALAFGAMLL